MVLPGLTETGCYRGDTLISLDHEIVKDFYIDLSFNDSDPADITSDSVDYSVTTSLGYKRSRMPFASSAGAPDAAEHYPDSARVKASTSFDARPSGVRPGSADVACYFNRFAE